MKGDIQMLNEKGQRELAYVVSVTGITPIEGADRIECAHINGWVCVVSKGSFKVGDPAVFFEIDSKLPEVEPFCSMEFLKSKNYIIKTQKIRGAISQGLLLSFADLGWVADSHKIGDFVTNELGVVHAAPEEGAKVFVTKPSKNKLVKKLMRFGWFRKLYFWTKRKSIKTPFPTEFNGVYKTDQERVENIPYVLESNDWYWRTQKCDGQSATYILYKKKFGKYGFKVCSRNWTLPEDNSSYWEMAKKYNLKEKMKGWMKPFKEMKWVAWQGEICGPSIQNNPQALTENHLYLFHFTDSFHGRWDMHWAILTWKDMGLETVPIDDDPVNMSEYKGDMETFKLSADGEYDTSVAAAGCAREGYVYYNLHNPTQSFKNVSRKYLLKKEKK